MPCFVPFTTFTRSLLTLVFLVARSAPRLWNTPLATPQQRNGMEIAAVYLQPVVMEPDGMMRAEESDIHIEADTGAGGQPQWF